MNRANEAARAGENVHKLRELQAIIDFSPIEDALKLTSETRLFGTREFLFEGSLVKLSKKKSAIRNLSGYIFNDMFILAELKHSHKMNEPKSLVIYKRPFLVQDMAVKEGAPGIGEKDKTFQLVYDNGNETLNLQAGSGHLKTKWVALLNERHDAAKRELRQREGGSYFGAVFGECLLMLIEFRKHGQPYRPGHR